MRQTAAIAIISAFLPAIHCSSTYSSGMASSLKIKKVLCTVLNILWENVFYIYLVSCASFAIVVFEAIKRIEKAMIRKWRNRIPHSAQYTKQKRKRPKTLTHISLASLCWEPRQTVQTKIRRRRTQNAASDQGLHCLLIGISIRNRIKMTKYTRHP